MSKFLDGPASGTTLMLRRAPIMLRAVCGPNGEWDALDQLDDDPKADERIVVYVMVGVPMNFHVCARRSKGSGFYSAGDYRVLADQQSANRLGAKVGCFPQKEVASVWDLSPFPADWTAE